MEIDTRTYAQIHLSLQNYERRDLTMALMRDLIVSDSTLRSYRLGRRTPDGLKQKTMESVIRRMTGIPVSAVYLFPEGEFAKRYNKEHNIGSND